MEESEIVENTFSLIFAFDEIVALGYRENVNLAQIRTFTEMDSHEEKVFQAVRQVTSKSLLLNHVTQSLNCSQPCNDKLFNWFPHVTSWGNQNSHMI
jgi:hypothetical protein